MPNRKPLIQPHPVGPYSTYRLFEWCMATMMVLCALTLALPGDTMDRNAFKPLANMGFDEPNLAVFFACVGCVRCLALYLNGHINNFRVGPKGAYIRATCSAAGCIMLSQFTAALIWDGIMVTDSASLMVPVFGTLGGFEALSVYVAIQDAQSRRDRLSRAVQELGRLDV